MGENLKLLKEVLGESFKPIEERARTSTIRRTRTAKMKAAAGRKALNMAKATAAYKRYKRMRALALLQKRKIQRKYGRRALSSVKRSM